ncbi:MAG: hypothetical protein WC211_09005 [Dehalococcoidia bacterium]
MRPRQRPHVPRAALVAGLAVVVLLVALTARAMLATPPATPGALAFAYADGRVEWVTAGSEGVRALPADALVRLYADSHTQLALDVRGSRLWYSDSHTAVRSIDLATLEPTLTLTGFADAALVGCATISDGRPIALDATRRRLFVPVGTGGVLVYDPDTLTLESAIATSAVETEPGLLPALAVDPRSGALWYGARNGDLVELAAGSYRPTGRRLAYAPDAHVLRSLAVVDGQLVALAGDGGLRAYDLATTREVEVRADWRRDGVVGLGAG